MSVSEQRYASAIRFALMIVVTGSTFLTDGAFRPVSSQSVDAQCPADSKGPARVSVRATVKLGHYRLV
jgi:hypothetical protein